MLASSLQLPAGGCICVNVPLRVQKKKGCNLHIPLLLSVQVAVTRGTPIMSEKWITECWDHREDTSAICTQLPFSEHKQLPFTGCVLALFGFLGEEEKEMKEIAVLNGEVWRTLYPLDVTRTPALWGALASSHYFFLHTHTKTNKTKHWLPQSYISH